MYNIPTYNFKSLEYDYTRTQGVANKQNSTYTHSGLRNNSIFKPKNPTNQFLVIFGFMVGMDIKQIKIPARKQRNK